MVVVIAMSPCLDGEVTRVGQGYGARGGAHEASGGSWLVLPRPKRPDLGPVEACGRAVSAGCSPGAVHVDVCAVAAVARAQASPAVGADHVEQAYRACRSQASGRGLLWRG